VVDGVGDVWRGSRRLPHGRTAVGSLCCGRRGVERSSTYLGMAQESGAPPNKELKLTKPSLTELRSLTPVFDAPDGWECSDTNT